MGGKAVVGPGQSASALPPHCQVPGWWAGTLPKAQSFDPKLLNVGGLPLLPPLAQ